MELKNKPEGATHYGPKTQNYREGWFKRAEGGWEYFTTLGNSWVFSKTLVPSRLSSLVELPWSAGYLPPVGTQCGMFIDADETWVPGGIIAHVELDGVPHAVASDGSKVWHGVSRDFRQLNAPEQTAAERKAQALKEMQNELGFTADEAQYAYELGYRKP